MNHTIKNRKDLFEAFNPAGIHFQNRIVMAPMTRSRAIGNIPNDLMALYYGQRSSAGLVITEGTAPSPNGLGYARIPGIFSQEQVEGWKKVTSAVHKGGAKIFVQLMHVGRVAHRLNMPQEVSIIAPSAVTAEAQIWTDAAAMQPMDSPRAMNIEEIQTTISEFVTASKNAIAAGFDGVELHAANGYLLEQFLNPNSNLRTDEFGGTIENRNRFVLEVAKAVILAIGKDRVGIRISPYSTFNDMRPYDSVPETYNYLSAELQKLGLLYVHVIDFAARSSDEGLRLLQSLRKNFQNLLIFNGGYDRQRAELALNTESADFISFGSKFIANPDLPFRLKNNLELNVPDAGSFYTPDAIGFTDYRAEENDRPAA